MRRIFPIIQMVLFFIGSAFAQETPFVYEDHGKRDPFESLVSPSGAILSSQSDLTIGDMVLEGIIGGQQGNLAIINGLIVKPKDKLGLFMIEQIGSDQVILKKDQEKFILKLKKEE